MPILNGAFEVPVVRFFEEQRYAVDFAENGRVRFKSPERFRLVEGPRRDESEGVGKVATGEVPFVRIGDSPAEAALEVVTKNPVYVLCFSDAAADLVTLAKQFGRFMVRVDDLHILNAAVPDIAFEALSANRTIANVRMGHVEYDKGEARAVPNLLSAVHLAAFQKPACFAHEKEWRIAVKLSGIKGQVLERPSHFERDLMTCGGQGHDM